ncbi:helicase-related protein [uncultured Catenibacterium sp.]|uniref:helicase-related protein n=1 Tax=uncultured Catenibacterium sp. TaxID=286142 RepID=UPI0025E71240|nr:helicase-related protein [uncultured Catenibacterium sp.]
MKCPVCGNEDAHYIGYINKRPYCRKCIAFGRTYLDESYPIHTTPLIMTDASYHLSFTLSSRQQFISEQLITNYENATNSIVLAVCGSGKTEISYAIIKHVIEKRGRVCFTIPRRQLCIELHERIQKDFPHLTIGLLYGGYQENNDAPLIICTTHQLYRFVSSPFDLVIMDEADAFPFYGDDVLNSIFYHASQRYIKLSATLLEEDIHDECVMIMNRRYHGHDLPVPHIYIIPQFLWAASLKYWIKKLLETHKRVLVYVPRVSDAQYYADLLKDTYRVKGVSSESPYLNEYTKDFKEGLLDVLITTTILERGITIEDVQVIVLEAGDRIFDERTLIQIAGRVGRKIGYEDGRIVLIDDHYSKAMKGCIKTIQSLNRMSV